jgi:hypothetical protein
MCSYDQQGTTSLAGDVQAASTLIRTIISRTFMTLFSPSNEFFSA